MTGTVVQAETAAPSGKSPKALPRPRTGHRTVCVGSPPRPHPVNHVHVCVSPWPPVLFYRTVAPQASARSPPPSLSTCVCVTAGPAAWHGSVRRTVGGGGCSRRCQGRPLCSLRPVTCICMEWPVGPSSRSPTGRGSRALAPRGAHFPFLLSTLGRWPAPEVTGEAGRPLCPSPLTAPAPGRARCGP